MKILTVTSMVVPFYLQALQHKLFYCHRLQSLLSQANETQSLNMLLLIEYLSWKCKLFSTAFWSGRIINATSQFSFHAIATTQSYFSRIRFFLLSLLLLHGVYDSLLIFEEVVQKHLHSNLISLHTSHWDIYLTSCCYQFLGVYECDSNKYPHWCYKYLWRFSCHGLLHTAQAHVIGQFCRGSAHSDERRTFVSWWLKFSSYCKQFRQRWGFSAKLATLNIYFSAATIKGVWCIKRKKPI